MYSNPAYRPQPASYADYASAESSQFGQTLYKDASGTLYTADGNPFTPGAAGNYTAPPADNSGYDPNSFYQYNANTGLLAAREGRPAANTGLWMQ